MTKRQKAAEKLLDLADELEMHEFEFERKQRVHAAVLELHIAAGLLRESK